MLFRRLVLNAVIVGVIAGLLLSVMQVLAVNPIIFAAEVFEHANAVESSIDQELIVAADDHHHSHDGWAPEDGTQRLFFSFIANVMAGIGFALMVLALMSQLQLQGIVRMSLPKGLTWGVAGFLGFFLAPGIGMPPEIPGAVAAPIVSRQLWWILAVAGVSVGLLLLAYAPVKWKAAGLLSVALPYLVSIPHSDAPMFSNPDPAVVNSLTDLQQQFFIASGLSNFVFWLAIGAISAWILNRWVLSDRSATVGEIR